MKRRDLDTAAAWLRRGGIVAYPTESCYGLGCDPRRHDAVRRLLRLKRRARGMGLILIADHHDRLHRYVAPLAPAVRERVLSAWPGSVTWLLPARPGVSGWLRGAHAQIAVRVTAHPGAAALCRRFGAPVVSTSANHHGHPPARSAAGVRRAFGHRIDYVLEGPLGGLARPTEIRDGITGKIVRPG